MHLDTAELHLAYLLKDRVELKSLGSIYPTSPIVFSVD